MRRSPGGQSDRLLVIDEVHASNHFMARIIESLVELFALSGGHVLMMSATLGGAVRERFLHVYRTRKAVGRSPVPDEYKCIEAPYPLISSTVSDLTVPSLTGRSKAVAIELRPEMTSPEKIATEAIEAAAAGACVLILRNSVTSAIETLKELENQSLKEKGLIFNIEGIPTLHHARFAPADRARLDQEVECIFGKKR